jgi:hypothetical protein
MKGRTTGKEITDEVIKCVTEKLGLHSATYWMFVLMAPSMRGKNVGAVTVEKYAGKKIIKTECIIRQQVLCSKVLNFEHVMSVAVSIVNFVRSRGLAHRLFRTILEEVSANCSDLLITPKFVG